MKFLNAKMLFFTVFGLYLLFIVTGVVGFTLWSQVEYLHTAGFDISMHSIYNNAHALRYALVYPIYFLAETLGLSANGIFSVLVVFMFLVIAFLLSRAVGLLKEVSDIWFLRTVILMFFLCLSLFMNGRLVFGFFAYSTAIYAVLLLLEKEGHTKIYRTLLLVIASLFLSSVSSGVAISLYLIVFSFVIFWFFISLIQKTIKEKVFINLCLLLICVTYTPIMLLLIDKNVTYYGGGQDGVVAMTQHGAIADLIKTPNVKDGERIMSFMDLYNVLFFCFIVLLISFVSIYLKRFFYDFKLLFVAFCLASLIILSLFANSILMLAFVPSLIASIVMFDTFKSFFRKKLLQM